MPSGIYVRRTKENATDKQLKHWKSLIGGKRTLESRRKMSAWQIGRKMSKESIEKTRLGNIGKKLSPEHKKKLIESRIGKPGGMLGHKQSVDARRKISEALRGENGSGWKVGINPENNTIRKSFEYQLWRESVIIRDNWTCQKCTARGGKIIAHHIKNFSSNPEIRTSIENGITLCKNCHKDFHKKYSMRNNNEKQLLEFLNLC